MDGNLQAPLSLRSATPAVTRRAETGRATGTGSIAKGITQGVIALGAIGTAKVSTSPLKVVPASTSSVQTIIGMTDTTSLVITVLSTNQKALFSGPTMAGATVAFTDSHCSHDGCRIRSAMQVVMGNGAGPKELSPLIRRSTVMVDPATSLLPSEP